MDGKGVPVGPRVHQSAQRSLAAAPATGRTRGGGDERPSRRHKDETSRGVRHTPLLGPTPPPTAVCAPPLRGLDARSG